MKSKDDTLHVSNFFITPSHIQSPHGKSTNQLIVAMRYLTFKMWIFSETLRVHRGGKSWSKSMKTGEQSNRADPCFSKRALKTVVYWAAPPAMGVWPGLTANEICPLIDCMTLWVFIVTKAQRFSSSYKLIENKKDDIFMCCITFLVFGGILSRCHWEPQKSTQVCGNTFKLKSSKAKLTFLIIQWRKLKEVPSG